MHYGHGRYGHHYGRRANPGSEVTDIVMNTWGCYDPNTLERLPVASGQRLYIVRGLPGAGKSTIAEKMAAHVASADDYFMDEGEYLFDPTKLGAAHADCQTRTRRALETGEDVAVANTFTQRWEMQPYLKMAADAGACVCVVNVYDGGLSDDELAERNIHGVPLEAIEAMRTRYEDDWQNGNPLAPWERAGARTSNPAHTYEVYHGGRSLYRGHLRDAAMSKFMSHHNRSEGETTFSVDDDVIYRGGGGGHVRLKNPRVQGYRADESGSPFDDYDDFDF